MTTSTNYGRPEKIEDGDIFARMKQQLRDYALLDVSKTTMASCRKKWKFQP